MYQFKINDPHFLPQYGCDVELSITSSKVITIVGENGLGKTSLLRRFNQLRSNEVSYIEQAPIEFFYDRKLHQLKDVFLYSRKSSIDVQRFEDCWRFFGLDQKENRLQSELSGGEAQALKLCLGLASNKKLFFLDEPSQFLDVKSKSTLNKIIEDALSLGFSFLMVEHDLQWQSFPMTMCKLEVDGNKLKVGQTWTT